MINYDNRPDNKSNWPTIMGSNILYLIVLTLMLASSILFGSQDISSLGANEFYFRTFVLEVGIIGVPPLLYLLYKRADVSKVIRLNRISAKEVFLVIGMAIFGYGIVIFINYIWLWIISHIGPPIPQPNPPIQTGGQYVAALICVAVVPALVEEFLFRGVIMRGYETMGRRVGIIMSGILFAILHMSLASLPAIILLGIVISYIVQRSDSILTGMVYHFTNNAIAVTLVYASNNMLNWLDDMQTAMPDDIYSMPTEAFLMGLASVTIIMLFSLAMFLLCLAAFRRSTRERALKGRIEMAETLRHAKPAEMIPAIIGIVVISILLIFEILAMAAMG